MEIVADRGCVAPFKNALMLSRIGEAAKINLPDAQTGMPACPSLMLWTGPTTGIAMCQHATGFEEQWR